MHFFWQTEKKYDPRGEKSETRHSSFSTRGQGVLAEITNKTKTHQVTKKTTKRQDHGKGEVGLIELII